MNLREGTRRLALLLGAVRAFLATLLEAVGEILEEGFNGFMGCLALLLEIGLKLAFLVIAIVIAIAIYHALFGH
jgi:hypothetical protein